MSRDTRRGRPPHPDILTPTEWRVLYAVQHGLTNEQIARRRKTSTDAVKFHVANLLLKLGVRSRRELQRLSLKAADSPLRARSSSPSDPEPHHIGALGQVARTVRDTAASERWYREIMGLRHLYTFGTLAFFDLAGTRLMLSQAERGDFTNSILYFLTPDMDAAHALLLSRGVEFINAPHMIHRHADGTEEWMCFLKDLDGQPLGLMSRVAPRPPDPDQE